MQYKSQPVKKSKRGDECFGFDAPMKLFRLCTIVQKKPKSIVVDFNAINHPLMILDAKRSVVPKTIRLDYVKSIQLPGIIREVPITNSFTKLFFNVYMYI